MSDLDLDIASGERILLLGASGAGKSTLLGGLAGVLGDGAEDGEEHGELVVDGARPRPGCAGLLLQDPDAQVILPTVGDDVAFGAENARVAPEEILRRIPRALDLVGLDLPLDHPTQRLSGGQRQRLGLAGIITMGAGLVLLDEPTAMIDPAGATAIRDAVLRSCAETGATLVVVEHRVDLWCDHMDRVIVLGASGRGEPPILADGPPTTVLRDAASTLHAAGVWLPRDTPQRRRGADADHAESPGKTLSLDAAVLLRARDLILDRGVITVDNPLSLDLHAGTATCVTGANGTGKSTLVLTLAGLRRRSGGSLDPDTFRLSSRRLAARVGMVFQDPEHQFLARTVREELEIGPRVLGVRGDEARRRGDELLERLRLAHLAEANPFTLSGGEKRRLSVATMLSTRPDVVVMDEPTFGQDRVTFQELVGLFQGLAADGRTLLAVTHDPLLVAELADRTVTL